MTDQAEVDKKKGEVWNRTNKCQTSFAADYHCMMANYAAASNNSQITTNNNSESEKKEEYAQREQLKINCVEKERRRN